MKSNSIACARFVGMELVKATETYRNGNENLCLTFKDSNGTLQQVSIQAERGSDLFKKIRVITKS